jgi:starch-binding outer membrane protein, SusD/RagB family
MKRISKYLLILMTALFTVSCNDWLTLEPEDGVTVKDYFQSKEEVEAVIIGCYCSMMNTSYVNDLFLWGELRADMITGGTKPNASYTSIISGEISADNTVVKWSGFYTVINSCNIVIAYSDYPIKNQLDASYTQDESELFKAEAKAIRALSYFYLLRSFGEVPLVLDASLSDDQNYSVAKSSKSEVMAQIIKDLLEAESVMEKTPSYNIDHPKGRFTVWAVKALLADVYLWNEDYANTIKRCNSIIDSEQFSLIPAVRKQVFLVASSIVPADTVYYADDASISNLFDKLYATGNSDESILELNFNESKINGFFDLFSTTKNVLVANLDNIEDNFFPVYAYDANVFDIRTKTFAYKGTQIWKYMGITRKGLARTSAQSYCNWIFYRYPDVLLMKAEALIEQAKASEDQTKLNDALDLINMVRDRANAQDGGVVFTKDKIKAEELESFLLDERAREFLFEGKRWYDILRFAKRDNYSGMNYLLDLALRTSAPSEKQKSLQTKYRDIRSHYWPIYFEEVENNPLLVQNDYYKTN